MANTITNFLIGLGFDFDQDTTKAADSALDGVKTRALQVGAVLAGAFGLKALTLDFAQASDTIGKFSDTFGVIPNEVVALGRALELQGGSLEGFIGQLESIERLRAGLLVGDADFIARAGIAGINTGEIIGAIDATEAYISLADQFSRMSQQQRLNAAEALGLDAASIRLLSQGEEAVRRLIKRQQTLRPLTEEATEASAEFNEELQDLFTGIGGYADQISMRLLPAITGAIRATNEWSDANRNLLNSGINDTFDFIDENPLLVGAGAAGAAAAGAGGVASVSSKIPLIGGALGGLATIAARLAGAGAVILAAAELWSVTADDFENNLGFRPPQWLFDPLFTVPVPFTDSPANEAFRRGVFTPNLVELSEQDPLSPDDLSGLAGMSGEDQVTITPSDLRAIQGRGEATSDGSGQGSQSVPGTVVTSQRPIQIENKLVLDGTVIDRRIIDITNLENERALDDVTVSTGG